MASFRDNTTITTGSTVTQMTPLASTSNYVVQLDPVSGHFEIVDSSLALQQQQQTMQMQTTSTGGITITSTGNEETVYNIREEDFFRGDTGVTIDPQTFPEMDMDINDIFSNRSFQFIQQGDMNQQQQYINVNQHQIQGYGGGYEEISQISTADQETVQRAIDEVYTAGGGAGYSTMQMPNLSTFLQPGQQIIQMDNNFYICATPITQMGNNVPMQMQIVQQTPQQQVILATNSPQFQQLNVVPSPQTYLGVGGAVINSVPVPMPQQQVANPQQIMQQLQMEPIMTTEIKPSVIDTLPPQNQILKEIPPPPNPQSQDLVDSSSVPVEDVKPKITPEQHQQDSIKPAEAEKCQVSVSSEPSEILYEIATDRPSSEQDDEEDGFGIKIVGCTSTKLNEDEDSSEDLMIAPEDIKMEEEEEEMDATLMDVQPEVLTIERTPIIPELLRGYADNDDELLLAFKNRTDLTKTEICVYCYKWFDEKSELDDHIQEDHLKTPVFHTCKICDAKYFARILRLRHEKLHKYDMKYRSSVYLMSTSFKSHFTKRYRPAPFSDWYDAHLKELCELVENAPFDCFDCGLQFGSEDQVQNHYDRFHALQICGLCGKDFDKWTELKNHEKEFHGIYNISVNYVGGAWNLWDHWLCEESLEKDVVMSNVAFFHDYKKKIDGETVIFEEEFLEDTESFYPEAEDDEEELFIADMPSPKLPAPVTKGRKRASKSEAGSPQKIFRRESSSAQSSQSLNEQSAEEMLGEDGEETQGTLPFKCEQCPKSYDNENDLRRHVKCHSGEKQTLACQYCGKVFKTHSHKKEHERTHTGEKPYQCPICSRSFIQSSNLKKHIQTHKSQNTLQCGTCGKQFIKEASLVLHQRAHAQDRKFRCEVCDRAYNYASLLKRHMRIHTGEMPYSCESCGMLFHELVSLHYHRKKVHTGERPHKCEVCGRAFILSSDLKKHVQIHSKPPLPPSAKTIRRRSQSKSTEKSLEEEGDMDEDSKIELLNLDEDLPSNESEPTTTTSSIAEPETDEAETPHSVNSVSSEQHPPPPTPMPESSQSVIVKNDRKNEGIGNNVIVHEIREDNKRTILRVYKRRETPTKSVIVPNTNNVNNSEPSHVSSVQQQLQNPAVASEKPANQNPDNKNQELLENLPNETSVYRISSQNESAKSAIPVSTSKDIKVDSFQVQFPTRANINTHQVEAHEVQQQEQVENNHPQPQPTEYSTSQSQGQMEIHKMFPQGAQQLMDSSTYAITSKNIEELAQLTNLSAFGDFDMNNIIVVPPEASSEIEIILEDQNH